MELNENFVFADSLHPLKAAAQIAQLNSVRAKEY